MEQPKKYITINYQCDDYGNHDCLIEELTDMKSKLFTDPMDAIHFIGECTFCEHNLKDIHPELFYWENMEEITNNSNKELEEYRINTNY